LSKFENELNANLFSALYEFHAIGLRYANIFGCRQDPNGAYAAVIPKWIHAMLSRDPFFVNGDGEQTRDFCHVSNVVQANLLAATFPWPAMLRNAVFNIGTGRRISLNQLFRALKECLVITHPELRNLQPVHRTALQGEVRNSELDIRKAKEHFGYAPSDDLRQELMETIKWYHQQLKASESDPSSEGRLNRIFDEDGESLKGAAPF
jgi:UDP-N-acetylglucosamine 4-epimerase